MYGKKGTDIKGGSYGTYAVFSPRVLNRSTELYAETVQAWGKRTGFNRYWNGDTGLEYMYKRKIYADQIAHVVVPSGDRAHILNVLKQQGVTDLDGQPIDDDRVKHRRFPDPHQQRGIQEEGVGLRQVGVARHRGQR